ncbi:MAG: glycosyl transferase family 2, partial [Pseudomonadota bacterium]
ARRVKEARYRIWLGLAEDEAVSLRDNRDIRSIWKMVARTAFTQLRYSPLLLAGSIIGMALLYLAAPLAVIHALGTCPAGVIWPGLAWGLMALAYLPTIRLYGLHPGYSLLLPVSALFYMIMTIDSARQHWLGRGGAWKGRVYPADD